jgi:cysteine desulfurase family protein
MIYLDSGATTLEKPESVRFAVAEALTTMSSPGRGNYPASRRAEETAYQCRVEAGEMFGVSAPENVIFTMNATHGLNIAIQTLVREGSRVVVSGYEHNAVTRVLHMIPDVSVTVVDAPLFSPNQMLSGFEQALRTGADVAICNHVSNVFGNIAPVEEIAALCRGRGVPLIVDASQSAGVLPVHLENWGAAFVAMPGHKGLYGPQGMGLLLCGREAQPLLAGGTGSASIEQIMPAYNPDRLEAGTHNMPGIAGLLAGIRFVRQRDGAAILQHEKRIAEKIARGLEGEKGVHVYACPDFRHQTGVVSFTVDGMDVETVGEALAQRGIAVRSGLQCAPLAHRTAGTLATGTVRVSPSIFNRTEQADQFLRAVHEIITENIQF